jgi:hypothetical protein
MQKTVNPAEFIIDLAAIDNRSPEHEASSSERVERLQKAWLNESVKLYGPLDKSSARPTLPTTATNSAFAIHSPFIRQTRVLTHRTFLTTYRDPMGVLGSLLEALLVGVITGLTFLQLNRDLSGIRSRQGALYNAAALQGYLILMFETYRLTVDIPLFDREHNENVVDVLPFLLSRRMARLFLEDLPVPLLFSVIFYWMAGLGNDASNFFIFFSIVLLFQYIGVTFATVCVAASRSFAGASLVANLGYTIQTFACGYFIQADTIPVYVRWLKWTSFVFYGFW